MLRIFKKSYGEKDINFFRYLGRMKIFEQLTYEEMALFKPYFYLREYKMDEVVFFRNDPSNALYLVKSGKVSFSIDVKNGFETMLTLKSGNAFGENALLENGQRLYNAIVISEKSELYVLPKVNIDDILENHVKVKAKMMESLAEIYNDYNLKIFKGYKSSLGIFHLGQVFGN